MRFIAVAFVLALAACGGSHKPVTAAPKAPAADPYANGRAIFMTGRDLAGRRITASPAPLHNSCMQCHLANGSGGMHLPGGAVSADLRRDALTRGQKHPYTTALLERAISSGIDNDGQQLSAVMPRWKMSQTDLRDVAKYVYDKLK